MQQALVLAVETPAPGSWPVAYLVVRRVTLLHRYSLPVAAASHPSVPRLSRVWK